MATKDRGKTRTETFSSRELKTCYLREPVAPVDVEAALRALGAPQGKPSPGFVRGFTASVALARAITRMPAGFTLTEVCAVGERKVRPRRKREQP